MSTGSQVNLITQQLVALLVEIRTKSTELGTKDKAPNANDPRDAECFEKVSRWQDRLPILIAQLQSLRALTEHQRTIGTKGLRKDDEAQRQMAYRAHQTADQHQGSIRNAQDIARDALASLDDLLARLLNPHGVQRQTAIVELIKNQIDFAQKLGEWQEMTDEAVKHQIIDKVDSASLKAAIYEARGPFITSSRQAGVSPDYFGAITLVMTLIRILWLKRIQAARKAAKSAVATA